MATQIILDTDILSAVMRKNPVAISKARHYLAEHGQFIFSVITRYEILRGLKANRMRLLLVAYAERGKMTRLISARQATRRERRQYEEGKN